ncbi:MAG: zinc dependent phospholipase C family protein, partial [Lachnospiraceae bacterium]|nr:zinc dependent phospholipase C family protein [Lachnospiraceae bacterium]
IGSIVPDCIPSFITRRHNMEQTFDIFVNHMEKFVRILGKREKIGFRQSIRMGMILHYIADYFTMPHNSHYEGGFKEHCVYEGAQLKCMRNYVKDVRSEEINVKLPDPLKDVKQVVEYIKEKHKEYVELHQGVKDDCEFSLEACLCVALSLFKIGTDRYDMAYGLV